MNQESLGLSMGGNDPKSSVSLFTTSDVKGITYSNNDKKTKNSLAKHGSLKFETEFASSIFTYKWRAESIKIVDDIAAVAYPNYTDINKVELKMGESGIYTPFYNTLNGSSGGGGCGPELDYSRMINGNFLTCLDMSKFLDGDKNIKHVEVGFESLYIIVEYDGYYTDSTGELKVMDIQQGKYEVFKYSHEPEAGEWGFASKGYNLSGQISGLYKFPILKSKYTSGYFNKVPSALDSRISGPQYDHEQDKLAELTYDIASQNSNYCVKYGFVGCKSIALVKYTPAVKCGRIDLYSRKYGTITKYQDGYYISDGHGLLNGDIIEVVSTNQYGVSSLTGDRYVQVRDDNSIFIYSDPSMTNRIYDENIRLADFNCKGNVYNNENQGWKYSKTIFSPHGRNGQNISSSGFGPGSPEPYIVYDSSSERPLGRRFAECKTFDDIFIKDYTDLSRGTSFSSIQDDQLLTNGGYMPIRTRASSLDCLWGSTHGYIHSYRFGADIDTLSMNNKNYILVGEPGLSTIVKTLRKYTPYHHPRGKAHLFTLSIDSNKSVIVDNSDKKVFTAGSSDTNIKDVVTQKTQYMIPQLLGSQQFLDRTNLTNDSASVFPFIHDHPNHFSSYKTINVPSNHDFYTNDYWYGGLVAHRGIVTSQSFNANNDPDYDNAMIVLAATYSCDSYDPVKEFVMYDMYYGGEEWTEESYKRVPYIDSFGRSVCLGNINGTLIAFISSTNKTNLLPVSQRRNSRSEDMIIQEFDIRSYTWDTPYVSNYKNIDSGYVHVINANTGLAIDKIKKQVAQDNFSGSYYAQEYANRRYASCIKFHDGILYIGNPKAPEIVAISSITNTNNTSSIDMYNISTSSVTFKGHINNTSSANLDINGGMLSVYEKEIDIYKTTNLDNEDYVKMHKRLTLSDRFGEYFDIDNSILAVNAFSNTNCDGQFHIDVSSFSKQIIDFFYISGLNIRLNIYEDGNSIPIREKLICIENPNRPGYYYAETSGLDVMPYGMKIVMDLSELYILATDDINITSPVGIFYPLELTDGTSNNSADGQSGTYTQGVPVLPLTTESICDYILVYELTDSWRYITKLSSSIDKTLTKYEFATTIGLDYPASFRTFANKTYNNSRSNSVTWDTDLKNSFIVINDSILLKDPVGYAVFDKDKGYECVFDIYSPILSRKPSSIHSKITYSYPILSAGDSKAPYFNTDSFLHSSFALLTSDSVYDGTGEVVQRFTFDYDTSFDIAKKDGMNLSMMVVDNVSDGTNVSIIGSQFESKQADLTIGGLDELKSSATLVTLGHSGDSNTANIHMFAENGSSNKEGMTLIIPNLPVKEFTVANLIISGGFASGSIGSEGGIDLIMPVGGYSNNTTLIITGLGQNRDLNNIPLSIKGGIDGGTTSENAVIIIPAVSGNPTFFIPNQGMRNLILSGSNSSSGDTTLVIRNLGAGGGEETSGDIGIALYNNKADNGVSILINGVDSNQEVINIIMPKTVGTETKDNNLFIRGYEE